MLPGKLIKLCALIGGHNLRCRYVRSADSTGLLAGSGTPRLLLLCTGSLDLSVGPTKRAHHHLCNLSTFQSVCLASFARLAGRTASDMKLSIWRLSICTFHHRKHITSTVDLARRIREDDDHHQHDDDDHDKYN